MRTILKMTAAVLAVAIVFLLATLPPAPAGAAWAGDPSIPPRTVAGAYHVHTTRSDGSADRGTVAAAAAAAGLQFVIFTDHGDGTRAPEPPAYLSGVLCLDGVEISTNGGHYVAIGLPQSPYPLGGEPAAVVEDVARLGGFGVTAHPDSPNPELAWTDWTLPVDGVEWLNADSEWRDEPRSRVARALFDYLVRPAPALATLLDRPVITLTRWDALASRRPVVGLAGHDAHGGIGRGNEGNGWRGLPMPSYEASFRTFSTRAVLDAPFTGEAAADAEALLTAIEQGRIYTAIDGLARPGYLHVRPGTGGSSLQIDASTVAGSEIVVLHAAGPVLGSELQTFQGGSGTLEMDNPRGSFRVEVRIPQAPGTPPVPWLVSNPVYLHPLPAAGGVAAAAAPAGIPFPAGIAWSAEHDPGSSATASGAGASARLEFHLGAGEPASQFAALAGEISGRLQPVDTLTFDAQASRPMRVSVQLRYPSGGGERWGRSVYLDSGPRQVTLRLEDLLPLGLAGTRQPDPSTAQSLLFVVDLTNARPGDSGRFEILNLAFGR